MLKLKRKGKFDKMYRGLVSENPGLTDIIAEKTKWFVNNPDDTRLDNHALTGRLEGRWAFSINDDIRIVYELIGKNTVILLKLRFESVYTHLISFAV